MENNFPLMLTFVLLLHLCQCVGTTPQMQVTPLDLGVSDVNRMNPPSVHLCAPPRPSTDSLCSSQSVLATVFWQSLQINFRVNLHFLKCVIPASLS